MATGVTITRDGLPAIRFADSTTSRPDMAFDEQTGRYRLTITYQPLEADGLLGSPVSELARLRQLEVRYQPVLEPHNLRYVGLHQVSLRINGDEVVLGQLTPADSDQTLFDLAPTTPAALGKFGEVP